MYSLYLPKDLGSLPNGTTDRELYEAMWTEHQSSPRVHPMLQDDFVADMESDCEEGRYFIPVVGDEVTCVYSAVMNAFGGAGGFTALLNKLRNTQNGREGRLTRVLRVLEPMSRAHALVDRNGDFEAFGAAARAVIFRVILGKSDLQLFS